LCYQLGRKMDYRDLIKALFDRSGLKVKDYAERIGWSTTQMSNVLNDVEAGSFKMLRDCLDQAGKKLEDCLTLPGDQAEKETELVGKLLYILRNDPTGKHGITVNIEYIYEESRRRVRKGAVHDVAEARPFVSKPPPRTKARG